MKSQLKPDKAGPGGGRCCLCQRGHAPGWPIYTAAELVFCPTCVKQRRGDVDERIAFALKAQAAGEAPPVIADPAPAAPPTSFATRWREALEDGGGKVGRAGRAPRRGGK